MSYVLPNRKSFSKFMEHNFAVESSSPQKLTCDSIKKKTYDKLFPHQTLIKRFLAPSTPYRGLLLYHQLGGAKTCSSIATIEQYRGVRKLVVMLPASLATNYKSEMSKCGKDDLKPFNKKWSFSPLSSLKEAEQVAKLLGISPTIVRRHKGAWKLDPSSGTDYASLGPHEQAQVDSQTSSFIDNEYMFVHYNGLTSGVANKVIQQLNTEDCVVVIDEVHNFISKVMNNPSSWAARIHDVICKSSRTKVIALSGTPIINYPREIAFLVNLVKGLEKLHVYSFSGNASNVEIVGALSRLEHVDYVHSVNFKTMKIMVKMLPDGFRRSRKQPGGVSPRGVERTNDDIAGALSSLGVKITGSHTEYMEVLPQDEGVFNSTFIDESTGSVKNQDMFMRRCYGFASHYDSQPVELYPTVTKNEVVICEMSPHQFEHYQSVRLDEIKRERLAARKNDNKQQISQVYKAFSRMACNFVFPEDIKRPFPSNIETILANEIDAHGSVTVDKSAVTYESALDKAIAAIISKGGKYLKDELHTHSCKYVAMLDNITKCPGSALVYSQFRKVEGLALFGEVLKQHGYAEFKVKVTKQKIEVLVDPKDYGKTFFAMFMGDNTKEESDILLNVFNSNMDALPVEVTSVLAKMRKSPTNLRGELIKVMMITASGAEGITLRNVRQVNIMEPYWNNIRLDQVIGRAVRTCSHALLPADERNVEVYTYIAKIPSSGVEIVEKLKENDEGQTSDEMIRVIAEKKTRTMKDILDLLKRVAVDCKIHGNKKCYELDGDGLVYNVDIKLDEQKLSHKGQRVFIKGAVYLLIDGALYDWDMYVKGVLKRVGNLVRNSAGKYSVRGDV